MKPVHVCHVIHDTQVGGTESVLFSLLSHNNSDLARHSVVSLKGCGPIGQRLKEIGIPVYAASCMKNGGLSSFRTAQLLQQMRHLRPDILQTWGYHANLCGGLARYAARLPPVIWNIRHSTLEPKLDSRNTIRSAMLGARISSWVPTKILYNSFAAVASHARVGYDETKAIVIDNGVDTQLFQPCRDVESLRASFGMMAVGPYVGMCGRFHPHKGQADFLRAALVILQDWPDSCFVMMGEGCVASNTELQAWIAACGLQGRVHLLGPRDDLPRIMPVLDVLVLPSLTEGMPNVVGEAMSCGVLCAVTDVGDARRLVGPWGKVVPRRDPVAMSIAVSELLRISSSDREAIQLGGRQRIVEQFALSTMVNRYEELWKDVASTGTRSWFNRSLSNDSKANTTSFRSTLASATTMLKGFAQTNPDGALHPATSPRLVHVTTIGLTPWLFLRGQNQFMHDHGFDVHIVCSPGEHSDKLRERDPVQVHNLLILRQISPWSDLVALVRLWLLFRELKPQIVQLSTPKAALLGSFASWLAGVPIRIYQIRGLSSESEVGTIRWLFQRLEWMTARFCNAHLVNAYSLLDYARRKGILGRHEGYVARMGMSNGVDLERFQVASAENGQETSTELIERHMKAPSTSGLTIGFVGRLARDKGIEDLAQAWKCLKDTFPRARLLLVGPWEEENGVSSSCRQGLLDDARVEVVGLQEDVVPFYRRMDLFVFPSHGTEGFPNAPMEAAAMGLPVIATRVIGNVDAVVDGVTGTLVSPGNVCELVEALRGYLTDSSLRMRHGSAGIKRVRSGFAPELLWEDFLDYYRNLLEEHGIELVASKLITDADDDQRQAA